MLIELSIIFMSIALAVTIFLALCYFGLFESITIKTGESPYNLGGRKFIYKVFKANSTNVGPNFSKLTGLLAPFKEPTLVPVLITSPLDSKSTKSLLGVIFEEDNDEVEKLLVSKDYKIMTLPQVDHVVSATFPNKGSISVVIALKRVYPLITDYIKENKLCAYPSIEVYKEDTIYFLAPLSRQHDFFINEDTSESSSGGDDSDDDDDEYGRNDGEHDPLRENDDSGDENNAAPSTASSIASSSSSFEQLIPEDITSPST